jgi:hypothetical protein
MNIQKQTQTAPAHNVPVITSQYGHFLNHAAPLHFTSKQESTNLVKSPEKVVSESLGQLLVAANKNPTEVLVALFSARSIDDVKGIVNPKLRALKALDGATKVLETQLKQRSSELTPETRKTLSTLLEVFADVSTSVKRTDRVNTQFIDMSLLDAGKIGLPIHWALSHPNELIAQAGQVLNVAFLNRTPQESAATRAYYLSPAFKEECRSFPTHHQNYKQEITQDARAVAKHIHDADLVMQGRLAPINPSSKSLPPARS